MMGSVGAPAVAVVLVFGLFAAFVPLLHAADPLCEGLPNDIIVAFPHEYNCSLFYECYNGNKTLNMCDGDLYYNPNTQSCDFQDLSGCTNGEPPATCENITLGYLPDPDDCTRYIECYEGDGYLMSCPPGLWFDVDTKRCLPPDEANCVLITTPSWTTPNPLCFGLRPNQTQLYAYEDNCELYWRCTGAQLTLESCPSYLYFDEERQLCDFPETVDCGGGTRTPDPSTSTPPPTPPSDLEDPRCQDGGVSYWSHPVFCDRYIECYNGGSYEMDCPAGLYFSQQAQGCVQPSQSGCELPTEPPTTVTFPSDYTIDPDCPYPEAEGKLLPYPGNCTKFYECAEGQKVEVDCPDGLWFNSDPDVNECDYPYQTDCPWAKRSILERIYRFLFRK